MLLQKQLRLLLCLLIGTVRWRRLNGRPQMLHCRLLVLQRQVALRQIEEVLNPVGADLLDLVSIE